jgi:hypothetical protein
MTQGAFVLMKFLMRFDAMEAPIDQDNLEKELQSGLTPKNDMKMRNIITNLFLPCLHNNYARLGISF